MTENEAKISTMAEIRAEEVNENQNLINAKSFAILLKTSCCVNLANSGIEL
jgi:hypothetical protein